MYIKKYCISRRYLYISKKERIHLKRISSSREWQKEVQKRVLGIIYTKTQQQVRTGRVNNVENTFANTWVNAHSQLSL